MLHRSALALILSTLFVRLRDIGQVWELALQLIFYASPIIYPIGFLPPWSRAIAFLNPFAQVLQDIRASCCTRDLPAESITAADGLGTPSGGSSRSRSRSASLVVGLLHLPPRGASFAERV